MAHGWSSRVAATFAVAFLIVGALLGSPASASDYPTRPITIIVPSGAGGGLDLLGRYVAAELTQQLGQGVVVDNKTGAGTMIGTEVASKKPADGYNLLVGGSSNMALNPTLFKNIKYDALNDFTPVAILVEYPMILLGRKDLPASTFSEFKALAAAAPHRLSYASAGVGSGQHVWTDILLREQGLDLIHVPFGGSAGGYTELLAGRVDIMMDNISAARTYVAADMLKPLAVTSNTRATQLPDVPTLKELGADFEVLSWMGIFAPRDTPPEVLAKLSDSLEAIRKSKGFAAFVDRNGGRLAAPMTSAQRDRYVAQDLATWKAPIERFGLQMQ